MRPFTVAVLTVLGSLAVAGVAEAQGIAGGARRGAAEGDRVGGPVGAVMGGVVGGAVGGAAGALGADPGRRAYRTGLPSRRSYHRRHRHHR